MSCLTAPSGLPSTSCLTKEEQEVEPWIQTHAADWRDDNFRKSGTLGMGDMFGFVFLNAAVLGATSPASDI